MIFLIILNRILNFTGKKTERQNITFPVSKVSIVQRNALVPQFFRISAIGNETKQFWPRQPIRKSHSQHDTNCVLVQARLVRQQLQHQKLKLLPFRPSQGIFLKQRNHLVCKELCAGRLHAGQRNGFFHRGIRQVFKQWLSGTVIFFIARIALVANRIGREIFLKRRVLEHIDRLNIPVFRQLNPFLNQHRAPRLHPLNKFAWRYGRARHQIRTLFAELPNDCQQFRLAQLPRVAFHHPEGDIGQLVARLL